ncbi:uncharacterized protein [Lepeophtheirus salmonis]|uniref:uncharacterized protein isoform X2 n=1 Tax=Lepeophtheirus salmonis TaxID=72036 RepID=UPI001AE87BB4|nr:RB-associated KRAB zinc finger protein-like isoform X1 [Lepeophtheirus salmonis]
MPSCCSVPGCSKRGGFRFPSNESICLQWRIALRRKDENNSLWIPSSFALVCDEHFKPDDYRVIMQSLADIGGKSCRRLKPTAVPSIFPWSNTEKKGDDTFDKYRGRKRYSLIDIENESKKSEDNRVMKTAPNLEVVKEEAHTQNDNQDPLSLSQGKDCQPDNLITNYNQSIQTTYTTEDLLQSRSSIENSESDSSIIDGMDVPTLLHGGSTFIYDYIKWHVDAPDDFIVEIVNDDELEDEENTKDPSPKIPKKSGRGSRGPEPKFVSSSPEYFCSICNRAFTTQFAHKRHNAVQHGVIAKDKAHFKCVECYKIFFCNDELNRHMIKAHNCPNTVIYRCDQCGRLFPSKYELARHKVKIHEPRTIPCTFCNEKFSRHFLMRDHMKRTHTRSLEVKCKTCNEMVPLSDMEAHMIREHSTTWKCLVCGKIFLKQSLMIQHELEQHSG